MVNSGDSGYLEEMSVPDLCSPAASPAEHRLHWVPCGGAREVVAEKAQSLTGFLGLLGEEQGARQGRGKPWPPCSGREGAWDLQTCLVVAP